MIIILALSGVLLATTVLICKSKKPLKHIWAEACYDFSYNILGCMGLVEDFVNRSSNKTELLNKSGKFALITGGTRGIGVEVIRMLMQCDINVVMGCRRPENAEKIVDSIRKRGIQSGSLVAYELDTSSLASVRKFAKIINENYNCLNYLINNAGIMYVPYSESEDGFESQFATNYLGHFLLTHLLLDLLIKGGSEEENARIVNVSSCAYARGSIDFENINKSNLYIPFEAYSQSKLAQIFFTKYLNNLLETKKKFVQVHSVHPGIVNTDLFDNTVNKKLFAYIIPYIFKNTEQGAFPIVHSCLSPSLEGKGGSYISNCIVQKEDARVNDKKIQEKLFECSLKWVNITNFGNNF